MNRVQISLVHCLLVQHAISSPSKHIQIYDCCYILGPNL
jgi:hypothetical protein